MLIEELTSDILAPKSIRSPFSMQNLINKFAEPCIRYGTLCSHVSSTGVQGAQEWHGPYEKCKNFSYENIARYYRILYAYYFGPMLKEYCLILYASLDFNIGTIYGGLAELYTFNVMNLTCSRDVTI